MFENFAFLKFSPNSMIGFKNQFGSDTLKQIVWLYAMAFGQINCRFIKPEELDRQL